MDRADATLDRRQPSEPWQSLLAFRRSARPGEPVAIATGALIQQPSRSPRNAYAGLLSRLRTMAPGSVPVVVIAGAAGGQAVARTREGLAEAARSDNLRLLVVPLDGEPRLTPQRCKAPVPRLSVPAAEALVTGSAAGDFPAIVGRRLEGEEGGVDFILVEGPPLDGSVEAVLLARSCDGLVIVVEAGVTPRESLARAVDLARESGCRLFGLVMSEPKRKGSDWLHRLIFGSSRSRR